MLMALSMPVVQANDTTQLLKLGLTSEDVRVLTNWHPNVMLVGTSQTTEAVLQALTSCFRQPVRDLDRRAAFPSPPQGTLILRELETLDAHGQQKLQEWLDGPGTETQVISLTSIPLYPRVRKGTFLSVLYYRLNTVHLEPSAPAAEQG